MHEDRCGGGVGAGFNLVSHFSNWVSWSERVAGELDCDKESNCENWLRKLNLSRREEGTSGERGTEKNGLQVLVGESITGVWLVKEWARNMEERGRNLDVQPRLLALITGKCIFIDLLWSMWWRQGRGQNQVLRIWGWWWCGGGMLTNSSWSESQECVVLCVWFS